MAFDEKLADRVRATLAEADAAEVRMFGGLGFMLNGNLVACVNQRGLLLRVGDAGKPQALAAGATPMVMNGREMKGFVWVKDQLDARALQSWLGTARAFVATLPPKTPTAKKAATKKSTAKKSAAKQRIAKKNTTKQPSAKKPTAKQPSAKKPSAKKRATKHGTR